MTIPSELKRSTPRTVSLTRAGWKATLWPTVWAICLVIGMQAPEHTSHNGGVLSIAERVGSLWNRPLFDLATILAGAVIGWIRYRSQAHLLMYGRAAVASVTDFDRRLWRVIFRRGNRIKCEFRLLNGSFCTAEVELPRRTDVPDIDEEIVIVYDRDHPKRAVLYPAKNLEVAAG